MRTPWWMVVLGILVLALAPAVPGSAQEAQDPEARDPADPAAAQEPLQEPGQETGAEPIIPSEGGPEVSDVVEQILAEDEAVLTGAGYTYDPDERRDPFKSLISAQKKGVTRAGPRPEGKAGLLIDELTLTGIFKTPEGTFAQVRGGPKNKSFLLQEGDQLYDGDVVAVDREEVLFKQLINDPAAIKPFRDVVKYLSGKPR